MLDLLAILALPAMAISLARSGLPADCDRSVTVVLGDTCDSICAKYNVSTYQLETVNADIIDAGCDNLIAGEVLCLGLTGQDCTTTYVVQPGDTCNAIADKFGIPESTLAQNNPNVNADCTNIYPKEVLCVSGTIYVNSTQKA